MPYIDKDLAIKTAIESCVKVVGHGITQIDAVDIANAFENIPTADVVPKSEYDAVVSAVDNSTKDFLKLHDDYQKANAEIERLKYNLKAVLEEIPETKREFASEIFAEIDKELDKARRKYRDQLDVNGVVYTNYARTIIAEPKKKYTDCDPSPAPEEKYFSPQQVRDMSPQKLHYNFEAIRKSMELWQI